MVIDSFKQVIHGRQKRCMCFIQAAIKPLTSQNMLQKDGGLELKGTGDPRLILTSLKSWALKGSRGMEIQVPGIHGLRWIFSMKIPQQWSSGTACQKCKSIHQGLWKDELLLINRKCSWHTHPLAMTVRKTWTAHHTLFIWFHYLAMYDFLRL